MSRMREANKIKRWLRDLAIHMLTFCPLFAILGITIPSMDFIANWINSINPAKGTLLGLGFFLTLMLPSTLLLIVITLVPGLLWINQLAKWGFLNDS